MGNPLAPQLIMDRMTEIDTINCEFINDGIMVVCSTNARGSEIFCWLDNKDKHFFANSDQVNGLLEFFEMAFGKKFRVSLIEENHTALVSQKLSHLWLLYESGRVMRFEDVVSSRKKSQTAIEP